MCWKVDCVEGGQHPNVIEHYLFLSFPTYHELERELLTSPARASPKAPPPKLSPGAQTSPLRPAGSVGSSLGPEWVPLEPCSREELFPFSLEHRYDAGTVTEEDTVFLAASRRHPWANTCAGRGMCFSPEDQDSSDAMADWSSEFPSDYRE